MLNTTASSDTGGGGRRRSSRLFNHHNSGKQSESVLFGKGGGRRDGSEASAAMQWEDLSSAANLPRLSMHTMTVVEGAHNAHLVIFGGLNSDNKASAGLHILDLDDASAVWSDATGKSDAPKARYGHGAAAVDGRLFVYGGWTQTQAEDMLDQGLYVLDVTDVAWKSLEKLPGRPAYGRAMFTMVTVRQSFGHVSMSISCNEHTIHAYIHVFVLYVCIY
jgi:hypothetical protein